jgi:hypothetical protein
VDLITVYTDIYNMRIELEKMKKPIGTRESPARSCKDLFHGHPQLKDGKETKGRATLGINIDFWIMTFGTTNIKTTHIT